MTIIHKDNENVQQMNICTVHKYIIKNLKGVFLLWEMNELVPKDDYQ